MTSLAATRGLAADFQETGLCIQSGLLEQSRIHELTHAYTRLILNVARALSIPIQSTENEYVLNDLVVSLFETRPEGLSFIYDAMNKHVALLRLFSTSRVLESVATLLNATGPESLAVMHHQFFIHRPYDERNLIGWHQDSGYYGEEASSEHSLTAWFCLGGCGTSDGALWVVPKSHKRGPLTHKHNEAGTQKDCPADERGMVFIPDAQQWSEHAYQVELQEDEIALMDFHLVHKSGMTLANRVRHTCLVRFANMNAPGYLPKYGVW